MSCLAMLVFAMTGCGSKTQQNFPQVLYDDNGLKVTATGYKVGTIKHSIEILIENNSGIDYTVMTNETSINGTMIMGILEGGMGIATGSKANCELSFAKKTMKDSNIKEVGIIEVEFLFVNMKDSRGTIETGPLSIVIDSAKATQTASNGVVILDENGIKVIVEDAVIPIGVGAPEVKLYIENNTENSAGLEISNVVVNGYSVTSVAAAMIAPGKTAHTGIQFFPDDFKRNGIKMINSVEFDILLRDYQGYGDVLAEKDNVSVTFQ